jgi:hypothetical protein
VVDLEVDIGPSCAPLFLAHFTGALQRDGRFADAALTGTVRRHHSLHCAVIYRPQRCTRKSAPIWDPLRPTQTNSLACRSASGPHAGLQARVCRDSGDPRGGAEQSARQQTADCWIRTSSPPTGYCAGYFGHSFYNLSMVLNVLTALIESHSLRQFYASARYSIRSPPHVRGIALSGHVAHGSQEVDEGTPRSSLASQRAP